MISRVARIREKDSLMSFVGTRLDSKIIIVHDSGRFFELSLSVEVRNQEVPTYGMYE